MQTEAQLEQRCGQWSAQQVWGVQMVQDIHQDLFARLPSDDRVLHDRTALAPGTLRRDELQVLAIAASHQRLAWIHPFRDGNGRVARLHTHLAAADEPRAGDLDGRGNLSEGALVRWTAYVWAQCADQVSCMTQMLDLDGMTGRIAACLAYEANVGQHGARVDALRPLHYLFATQDGLERADFKAMLGLGDRLATARVSALLARGLLQSDTPYGKLRFGVPQHALRFYFPKLWVEADGDS